VQHELVGVLARDGEGRQLAYQRCEISAWQP
jgi:hypothetical protein